MNKINKLYIAFKLLLKQPSLVNLILNSDYNWHLLLSKKHPLKKQLLQVKIEDLIPNFNETLTTFSFLGGGSLPTDIMLLKGLAKQIENCIYFEIGTWRGESVINVSTTAKQCYTLNLSKKEILNLKLPKKYADLHAFFSKKKENIIHLEGNSMDYDFSSLHKKFDLIFIDGNHTYDFVKNDTQKVFKHLMKENTIVVWHDYAYTPEKMRPEVLLGILDGIPKHCKENLYHVSNTMCAIYINKKITTYPFESIKTPDKKFIINAKVAPITSP